jgi:ribonucleoside-diphosphate reductase alpha chain
MDPLTENGLRVLKSRYLLRDEGGKTVETPREMFQRVAQAVAAAELNWGSAKEVKDWEEQFYSIMASLLFLPNSPTLMNAGTRANQLSACFVLPIEDSMEGIFTTLKQAALIQQSGGGTGFNFSRLRPKGTIVSSTGGLASGPVSFMKIFDAATANIKQGGKRRGANMGILHVDHPDLEEFISCKNEKGAFSNFNISVGIRDTFMQTVERDESWSLVHPYSKKVVRKISARKLWNEIVHAAWQTGDPGLIFLDTINASNPTPSLGEMEATNPCGEVPLLPFEPCNLGSLNLSRFLSRTNEKTEVDWKLLEEVIPAAIRFLDNVIEVNNYIIPEVKTMAHGNRKIGLGVMGWAEMLIQLEIPYESEEAVQLAEKLMSFINEKSKQASIELAKERDVFPNWKESIYDPDVKIRNATRTSIAPTGTISIIAGTSSSIEPLFALAYQRHHVLDESTMETVSDLFTSFLKVHHLFSKEIMDEIMRTGVAGSIKLLPDPVKAIFKTALEISPSWHLRHQLAFQKYTDNAVSKTINMPQTATEKDIAAIYTMAWKEKAKGITIFRNHSKDQQVLYQGVSPASQACKTCEPISILET